MSSFFGSFFGNDQRKDISNANQQAQGYLGQGLSQSTQAVTNAGAEAKQYWQPYAESGSKANGVYADSLGLNGTAGGQNALSTYQAGRSPFLDAEQDRAQRGLDRAANARGSLNSGANALAAARARQQMGYQDYSGWQDRLQGMSGQGMQAAGQLSGIAQNTGNALSGLYSGYGQSMAGNAVSYGNALASSRNIGINNLMQLGGMAVKATGAGGGTAPARPNYNSAWPASVSYGG